LLLAAMDLATEQSAPVYRLVDKMGIFGT
jgi:hypothetical protein